MPRACGIILSFFFWIILPPPYHAQDLRNNSVHFSLELFCPLLTMPRTWGIILCNFLLNYSAPSKATIYDKFTKHSKNNKEKTQFHWACCNAFGKVEQPGNYSGGWSHQSLPWSSMENFECLLSLHLPYMVTFHAIPGQGLMWPPPRIISWLLYFPKSIAAGSVKLCFFFVVFLCLVNLP